jgi:CheY-like chemotaxis protein
MGKRKLRLLWLDDKVAAYGPFVKALKENGFSVKTAGSVDAAIRQCKKSRFDLVLVDLKMPDRSGIDFMRYVKKGTDRERPNLCVLSSYLYLDEYRNMVDDYDGRVYVLEKNLPNPNTPVFRTEFVEQLKKFATKAPELTPSESEAKQRRELDLARPYDLPFEDYLKLSPKLKAEVDKEARRQAAETIEQEFERGSNWVLLINSPTNVEARADTEAARLNNDEINDLGIDKNRVPFQFEIEQVTEDAFACVGPPEVQSYPTVTLSLGANGRSHRFQGHFDTGSYKTYVSLEHWLDLTGDAELGLGTWSEYRGRPLYYHQKPLARSVSS